MTPNPDRRTIAEIHANIDRNLDTIDRWLKVEYGLLAVLAVGIVVRVWLSVAPR